MNDITPQQLRAMLTTPDADTRATIWVGPLNHCMQLVSISTVTRQAAFLAQVLHESSEFHQLEESLGYSAQRLRQVWPQRFPTDAIAAAYSHNPAKLANHVYANRMGNGDEASGDGWAYRGRGLIQLTGRDNYTRLSQAMEIDALGNPDLLLQPAGAALSAGWFWLSNGLNAVADKTAGSNGEAGFTELTRRINGATTGLQQRLERWQRARKALGVDAGAA